MKILHLTQSVGSDSGGLGSIALALATQHRKLGHEAHIWTADSPGVARRIAAEEGVNVTSLSTFGPSKFGLTPRGLAKARTEAFDVVHQHGIWTALSQVTNAYRSIGTPTVVAPQGSLEAWCLRRSRWKKQIALAVYESTNLRRGLLQATSETEIEGFRAFGLKGPVAVLPNGVASEWLTRSGSGEGFRSRHGIPANSRVLLFLSRIHPKKGLPLLIEAVAALRERLDAWTIVIAGMDEGGHRDQVQRMVVERDLASIVRFAGPVRGSDKRDAYAAADLFVLPTHSDNFAIVVTEALASGVPVITTHGAPWRDLVSTGAGWWVPVDVPSLTAALADALSLSAEELKAKGASGRTLVETRYTWEAVAVDTMTLYAWLGGFGKRPQFVVS